MSKERQILFSAPMVSTVLDGSKTQTRRVVKLKRLPESHYMIETRGHIHELTHWDNDTAETTRIECPYGQPGDRLLGRETFFSWGRWETRFSPKKGRDEWHFIDMTLECGQSYFYAADGVSETKAFIKRRGGVEPMYWKRPAIFMPRWASRITMEITGVRVERLGQISEEDARAEGIVPHVRGGWHWLKHDPGNLDDWNQFGYKTAALAYQALWESINGDGSWEANPFVWVVSFKRLEGGAA